MNADIQTGDVGAKGVWVEAVIKAAPEIIALVAAFLRLIKHDGPAEALETVLRESNADADTLIANAQAALAGGQVPIP